MKRKWLIAALVLLSVLAAGCSTKQQEERELKQTLSVMRAAIDQFTLDHQRYPSSLQELVEAGYLREIPVDPMTGRNDTWKLGTGSSDFHSGSEELGSDGKPYSSW